MLQNLELGDYSFLGGKTFSMKILNIMEALGGKSGSENKGKNKWEMGRI